MLMKNVILATIASMSGFFGVLAVSGVPTVEAAVQQVTITVEAPEKVIYADEGSTTRIRSEAVSQYAGYTCDTLFTSTSHSVHPGNDILVRSGDSTTTFEDIERAPGVLNLEGGQITLSNNVHTSLVMGPDGAYSAAYAVTLNCTEPTVEVCRDGVVETIGVSEMTSSDMPAPCPEPEIEVCRDGEQVTIKESERIDSDTSLPCPVEEITVCVDGATVTISADEYDPEAHTKGECQVTICRDGVQMTIVESMKNSTDTEAPCESEKIIVCRDNRKVVINTDDRKASDKALFANGGCAEVKAVVTELPKTGAGTLVGLIASTATVGAAAHNIALRRRQ